MIQLKIEFGHICRFITLDFAFSIDIKRRMLHFTANTNHMSSADVYENQLLKRALISFINNTTSIKDAFQSLMFIYDAADGHVTKFTFGIQKAVRTTKRIKERSYS